MALVAFLRGVNVGGHRRFRPSLLAKELAGYDVVNVGATGFSSPAILVRGRRSEQNCFAGCRSRPSSPFATVAN